VTNPPDPTLPTVTISAADANASEAGLDIGVFTLTRAGDLTAALTVNYTFGGTATAGSDYNALAASVTLPIGVSSTTVIVTPIDDASVEGSETVALTVSSSAAYNVGSPNSAIITIADNDSAPPVLPTVTVTATDTNASRVGLDPGTFRITRTGGTTSSLTVNYNFGGAAVNGTDFILLPMSVTIPAGAAFATLTVTPKSSTNLVGAETVSLTLAANAAYTVGSSNIASITIAGNSVPSTVSKSGGNMRITWASTAGKTYRVAYKNSLADASWTNLSPTVTATGTSASFIDATTGASKQRYYIVYLLN
jgi:hypothetical protein